MSYIKIKNFGPIKEGFADNDGFLSIDKLMLFIGGQGSGKSSIVKLISTLTWIEKALAKGTISIDDVVKKDAFKTEWCEWQSIQNYFKIESYIQYNGKYLQFKYETGLVEVVIKEVDNYEIPKITYIPAERNFLSVIEELEKVKGLPKSLNWTLEEYIKACRSLFKPIPIQINNIEFLYDKNTRVTSISGNGYRDLKLSEASSGIQSVVPMMVVLYYLKYFINNPKTNSIDNLSFAEREVLRSLESDLALNLDLSQEVFQNALNNLQKKFLPQYLFTIIEEIEQNLFPQSQKKILFKSFEFNNDIEDNYLILTTHSPYIIAYTTLAMKAFKVKEQANGNVDLLKKIEAIVSIKSCIDPNLTGIYQIDDEGKVVSIKSERGLILDNNFLNDSLENTNDLFNELLDIEDECKK
jgi:predicted ATPase